MKLQEHTVKCTVQVTTPNTVQSFSQSGQTVECPFTNKVVQGCSPVAVTSTSKLAPSSSKEFVAIQATTESGFTLKRVFKMERTNSHMHSADKY